ncbi:hypothetical protein VP01_1645g6 [Puccinia sorghi]|uniref:Uncharacterized protein n=1 Tax=Puccinia sorghi TaxID=27349 RepID=A0A0L6VGN6_9BASI|nr:hypothetical protein VP01_1645g6 [Puccinia sorghi]
MSHRAADASLLDQLHITPEEREFGWSGSLSGIRGLSEQQARRILHFENSLRQHLRIGGLENFAQEEQLVGSSDEFGNINSEPLEVMAERHYGATSTRNPFSPCILKPRASLPEYQKLASSRLNRSLRVSRSHSSFLRFRSLRRRSRDINWPSDSDEFSYLMARGEIANTATPYMQWETSFNKSSIGQQNGGSSGSLRRSKAELGLFGLFRTPVRTAVFQKIPRLPAIYRMTWLVLHPPFQCDSRFAWVKGHPFASLDVVWFDVSGNIISPFNSN